MILARPILLLALLALPALWLLARVAWQRRERRVSSLLVWERLDLPREAPRETRRRTDLLLWLRLAAAAAIAVAAAGPTLVGTAPPPVLHVLLDESLSMRAFAARAEDALARIAADAPGGARLRVHRAPGTDDLAAVLALAGDGSVVVVTDHPIADLPPGGRVRTFLVGEPVENLGIVSAFGGKSSLSVVVRNFGESARPARVLHPGGAEPIAPGPGEAVRVDLPAVPGKVRLEPGDRFAFDDEVGFVAVPPSPVALRWDGPPEDALRIALEVSGVVLSADAPSSVAYRQAPAADCVLAVAPPGGDAPSAVGPAVGGPGLPPEAVPGPEVALGRASRVPGPGEVLLADAAGPLAVEREGRIAVALDPGDAASGWARDPAFAIFIAEVARRLGAREGGWSAEGALSPAESATKPVSAPWSPAGLRARRSGPPNEADLSPYLLLAAAALVLAHTVLERGAAGR